MLVRDRRHECLNVSRVDVDSVQIVAPSQVIPHRSAAVRGESYEAAVRRPDGRPLVKEVVGQPDEILTIDVSDVEVGSSGARAHERDALAVRRPRGSERAVQGKPETRPKPAGLHVDDVKGVARTGLGDEAQRGPVGRPRRPGAKQVKRLEVVRTFALDGPAEDGPVQHGRHVDVRVSAAISNERDPPAVRRDRGTQVQIGVVLPVVGDKPQNVLAAIPLGHLGPVPLLERALPFLRELDRRESGRLHQGALEVVSPREGLDRLLDLLGAVRVRDEAECRLALLVHEVAPPEVLEGDDVIGQSEVAEYHLRLGVPSARDVLGQPLDEPQRDGVAVGLPDDGLDEPAVDNVEHEDVCQLVIEDVAEVLVRAREWNDDSVLEELRESPDGLADVSVGDVRLAEVVVRCVDDDRYHRRELVPEDRLELSVRGLDYGRDGVRQVLVAVVVVDVEVLGLDDIPGERAVLDLVPPKPRGERVGWNEAHRDQSGGD